MKYLKAFNETYQKIDNDTIIKKIDFDKQIPFTKYEIEELKEITPLVTLTNDDKDTRIKINNNIYDIYKLEDEWFLLVDQKNTQYYYCDQINGLIDCLNYLNKTKKLYENYNKGYQEIGETEFDNLMEGGSLSSEPFTKKEYTTIYDLFKTEGITIHFAMGAIVPNSIIEVDEMETIYTIWKFQDEWFYIDDNSKVDIFPYKRYYYKCDQFEGLTNCIKDTLGI